MSFTPENFAGQSQDPWNTGKGIAPRTVSKKGSSKGDSKGSTKGKKKRTTPRTQGIPEPAVEVVDTPVGDLDDLIGPSSPALLLPEISSDDVPPIDDLTAVPEFHEDQLAVAYEPPAPEGIPLEGSLPHDPSPQLHAQPALLDVLGDIQDVSFEQGELPPVRVGRSEQVTTPGPAVSSVSPPRERSSPFNHRHVHQVLAEGSGHGTPRTSRRVSTISPRPPLPPLHGNHPPLPHLPQPHFYSAPDLDFGEMRKRGKRLSQADNELFYAFDSLAGTGADGSETAENVLLVGGDGHLDVFRVEREKLGTIGHLRGLHGRVIGAKLLPSMAAPDALQDFQPLAALIIHGPESTSTQRYNESPSRNAKLPAHTSHEAFSSAPGSPTHRPQSKDGERNRGPPRYQTTVEIFSLKTRERVTTLFSSPPTQRQGLLASLSFSPPPPIGNLKVDAHGRYVIVASGASGEIYLFGPDYDWLQEPEKRFPFKCLGKLWAAVHPNTFGGPSTSTTSSGASTPSGEVGAGDSYTGNAIFSLSHRWLAYVPAKPSSHPSMEGNPLLADTHAKPPGLYTHTAPPQPQVTCSVDTPEGDSLFNRVAREVTQDLIKGAKWVGDQGLQAWRNYWKKPAQNESSSGLDGNTHPPNSQWFPPTHGHANSPAQSAGEPALVSILDLGRFDKGYDAPTPQRSQPIATFQAPLGCSFISFAPSGLQMLTASVNGDVQFVWDLMKMVPDKPMFISHAPSSKAFGGSAFASQGAFVRQIARFSRMTATNIVDVIWSSPRGERLAVVTEKGTVHMFDIPLSAFQWPPPRRLVRSNAVPGNGDEDSSQNGTLYAATEAAGYAVSAAVKMVNSKAQPLFAAARGRRSSSGAGAVAGTSPGSTTAPKAVQGGKIVAHGLSKSLGAATDTLNTIRSIGENRLHLPRSAAAARPGCARWLTAKETGLISVVGGGVLRTYQVRAKLPAGKRGKRQSLAGGQSIEIGIPNVSDRPLPSSRVDQHAMHHGNAGERVNSSSVMGYWNLRPTSGAVKGGIHEPIHPLSYAEIETNSPYQPFHTDRRVQLFTYEVSNQPISADQSNIHGIPSSDPWVFGQDIPATRVNVGANSAMESEGVRPEEDMLGPMENIMHRGKSSEDVEQLVITTRRRKRTKDGNGGLEDGFFEDDCEVLDFASNRV
ncbi:MAG: hypothetical protein M1816_006990 [Peltula sp. TS41687]|nr:MAG: hypothetical protein M1816_006990 [Peltula sp. TS41687]